MWLPTCKGGSIVFVYFYILHFLNIYFKGCNKEYDFSKFYLKLCLQKSPLTVSPVFVVPARMTELSSPQQPVARNSYRRRVREPQRVQL